MSDSVALDLFIQDFVNTNKLLGRTLSWDSFVSRRWSDTGNLCIYEFTSGGATHYARVQRIDLPDGQWLRVELSHTIPAVEEHRFDCLRMLSAATHARVVPEITPAAAIIRLITGNRGLLNVLFVVRDSTGITNPCLA